MSLRVNTQKTTRESYLNSLGGSREHQISAVPLPLSPVGIQLDSPCAVDQLPHFREGWVSVQDEAAQLAALLLQAQKNERILDACAAPGGKACHILEQEPDLASLVAVDLEENRNQRVKENLVRLGLEANVITADVSKVKSWWDGNLFDRILLDVPCSATGVIRRHPDIKWLRRATDIKELANTQRRLLDALWETLKPGGELLYCTCSVLPIENAEVIASFRDQRDDVEVVNLSDFFHKITPDEHACKIIADEASPLGVQLFPQNNGHDGFFYAKLFKQS